MMTLDSATRIIAGSLLVAHLLATAVCASTAYSSDTVSYGSKVKFSADRTLRFPGFEMTYTGKRHVTPPQYPRGWWIHDFKVRGRGDEQTVSWSAGTGDIGPTRFRVNGVDFQVELSRSDKLGSLREDELVVSSIKHP
ncbi:MAG TPA: hypothetical protein VNP98_18165 [Chthoniobacterales bacterium]|nr:hypothetical protein [Chthoniobacterales bacterium]